MGDHRDLTSPLLWLQTLSGGKLSFGRGLSPRPFLLSQRKPWLGTQLEYEGPRIPESWVHL